MVMGSKGPADIIGTQQLVQVGPVPHDLRAADFDRDGKLDLAILFAGSASDPGGEYARSATILFGLGDGSFRTPFLKVADVGDADALLEVGDFDANGWTDIAIVSPAAATIRVVWNSSSAVVIDFQKKAPSVFPCGPDPRAVRSADLDESGTTDLVLATAGTKGNIEAWRFENGGTAGEPARTVSAADPTALRVARLVEGGAWTAIVLDGTGALLAHEWTGDAFEAESSMAIPPKGTSLAVGDITGDGRADAVAVFRTLESAAIFIGREPVPPAPFVRGDVDADGVYTIGDAIAFLSFLFGGAAIGPCPDAADADDDGTYTLGDGVFILNYLFASGPEPPAPGTSCGLDPTEDTLDRDYGPCQYPAATCR
ncbi:MAG: hypothetical protein JXP34_29250 [Planctomycetes bacterium]|nr:hypothetical protein [Planctomycetota bacterium]